MYNLVNNKLQKMCKICENDFSEIEGNSVTIECEEIKKIPHIKGLEILDLCDCFELTSIPNIEGLQELYIEMNFQ